MNLTTRINSLYKTGVPSKFVINFAKLVKNSYQTEQEIHLQLKRLRINPSREFFKCPLTTIKTVFDKIKGVWWEDKRPLVEVALLAAPAPATAPPASPTRVKFVRRKLLNRKVKKSKFNYKF